MSEDEVNEAIKEATSHLGVIEFLEISRRLDEQALGRRPDGPGRGPMEAADHGAGSALPDSARAQTAD